MKYFAVIAADILLQITVKVDLTFMDQPFDQQKDYAFYDDTMAPEQCWNYRPPPPYRQIRIIYFQNQSVWSVICFNILNDQLDRRFAKRYDKPLLVKLY
ncbi:MAG: hypothetical protein LBG05_04400, partial [Treponema sp.]|nr:hypothetical protein [Treponema sp.]